MGWLKDHADDNKYIGRYSGVPAYFNLIGFGNYHDKEQGNTKIWTRNCKVNLKWLEKNKDRVIGSIDQMPKHEGQAIIFVGMGPSIKRSVKHLKNLDSRFVIVATNSSAKYLLDRGIKPHYVVALDGKPGPWTMDLGDKAKDIVGIFSTTVDPSALSEWPGKIIVVPYAIGPKSMKDKITDRFGKSFPGGGNAINGAVLIFVEKTEATIFLFVGNDLSFGKRYYADRDNKHDEETKFFTKDINGKKVRTQFPLWEYKVWLENLASMLRGDYWFCNCSEGILGVEVDGSHLDFITQMNLPDAIKEIKYAWECENLPLEDRAKIIYSEAYKSGVYKPMNGPFMWSKLRKANIEFKRALDVGCGTGQGIKECRDAGYDVWGIDIADNHDIWKTFGIEEYCKTAPAHKIPFGDDEFDFVVCSEVMEHIPEDLVIPSLKEILRVGSDQFLFTICLEAERAPLLGCIQTHITVRDREWWLKKIHDSGFKNITYDDTMMETYDHVTVRARKCQQ